MKIINIKVKVPEEANVIIGQTHFIKSVEDIYEAVINSSSIIKFGLAFNEASGPCLIRKDGNDQRLIDLACKAAGDIASGHVFVIYIKDGFPINILPSIKNVREVVGIYCATANPVEVIVAESDLGRGILGVIDGFPPKGIESDRDINDRIKLLRKFGYKR